MSLAAGSRLGAYEINSLLGAGGMGEVYRATDTVLKRQVALKILLPDVAADPERVARFQREAEVLASLNHPNIAHLYGIEQSNGTLALVMELVEGPTLGDRIVKGPIPLNEALPIANQIAEALEAAHEQGIIHRDLKPANIKVREDGTVKVLDFGLAKAMESSPLVGAPAPSNSPTITSPALVTGVGVLLGTAAYMSPEQAKGKPADKRSDIWAFGCVLFEMLTGARAFQGTDMVDVLGAVVHSEVAWVHLPVEIPTHVRQVLRLCLQKQPTQRLADIQDVRLALVGAFREADGAHPRRRLRTREYVAWCLAFALGGLLLARLAVPFTTPDPARRRADASLPVLRFSFPLSGRLNSGARSSVAIAPNGTRVAFAAENRLFIRSLSEPDAVAVSGVEPTADVITAPVAPFFSRDGQWLGFYERGQLKKVNVSGGAPEKICDLSVAPFGISWGPDNELLLGTANAGVVRVNADSGVPDVLFPSTRDDRFMANPQALPGGPWVLYTSWDTASDQGRVVVQSRTTKERRVLLERARVATYVVSGHLLFGRDNVLFAVAFSPAAATIDGTPRPVVDGVAALPNPAMQFAVSESGALIFMSPSAGLMNSRLIRVDRSGAGAPLLDVSGLVWFPRYSPNGSRLAYGLSAGGETSADLWVLDLARSARTRITFSGNNRFYPIWTRDGKRLTFADGTTQMNSVKWAPADGSGEIETLIEIGPRRYPTSWSPDGRTLALYVGGFGGDGVNARSASTRDIVMFHLDGGQGILSPFVTGPFEERGAVFSPDGHWVAYVSNKSGQNDIYARRYPSGADEVTISVGGGQEPVWAPSGREVFYRHAGTMYSVRVEEIQASLKVGAPVPLFIDQYRLDTGGAAGGMANYDIAPDGQHFVFVNDTDNPRPNDSARLQLVVNWFEELKARVPPAMTR